MKKKILLLLLTISFILLNFFLLAEFPQEIHRWGRVACSGVFLSYLIFHYTEESKFLIGSLVFFLLSDSFALEYDVVHYQQVFFALQSTAYLFMLFQAKGEIKKPQIDVYQRIFFLLILVVSCIFVIVIGNILSSQVFNHLLVIFYYIYGAFAVTLLFVGVLYYDNQVDDLSTAFVFSSLGLVFSNVTGFAAHFLEFPDFFYFGRLLYVAGLGGLAYYGSHYSSVRPHTESHW